MIGKVKVRRAVVALGAMAVGRAEWKSAYICTVKRKGRLAKGICRRGSGRGLTDGEVVLYTVVVNTIVSMLDLVDD